jgi:hypothetical protein
VGQVGEQEFHALSPVPAVNGVFVDVDNDESSDRELSHGGDELGAALVAAAVPVKFRLADPQAVQRFAYFSDIVIVTQCRGQ